MSKLTNNTRAEYVREWAQTNSVFFHTKADTFKQYTHSIFEGGILALSTSKQYIDLQNALIKDILDHAGKIVLCEGFPHIYGSCALLEIKSKPEQPLHVHPRLVDRVYRALRVPVPTLYTQSFVTECDTADLGWDQTCLAFDLDYGNVTTRPYREADLIKEIHIIQQVMHEHGATVANQTDCFVCVANDDNLLGVHLYFCCSVYYPEECMQLAELCRHALQERQPVPHCGAKSWSDIVDGSIYNKTLRMPFLQKAKQCEIHGKKIPRHGCCAPSGKKYCDRRYWPIGMVQEGKLTEREWLADIKNFIFRKEGRTTVPINTNRARSTLKTVTKVNPLLWQRYIAQFGEDEATKLVTDISAEQVADYLRVALTFSSLRSRKGLPKTRFEYEINDPIPNYPRPWKDFFISVYQYVQSLQSTTTTQNNKHFACALTLKEYEAALARGSLNNDTVYILKVKLFGYTNPLGEEFSNVELYQNLMRREGTLTAQELKIRQKFTHIVPETNREYDVSHIQHMGTEFNAKNVAGQYTETMANDSLGRCFQLQLFLRERMETDKYRDLQVAKIIIEKNGSCLVLVQGPGQHYCRIANRIHRHAKIYFTIDRRSAMIRQRCRHGKCQHEHERCFGVKMDADLQALFAPQEFCATEKKERLKTTSPPEIPTTPLSTPTRVISQEQKESAQKVLDKFPMYKQPMKSLPKPRGPKLKPKIATTTTTTTTTTISSEGKTKRSVRGIENVANSGISISAVVDESSLLSDEDLLGISSKRDAKTKEKTKTENQQIEETVLDPTNQEEGDLIFNEEGELIFVKGKSHKTTTHANKPDEKEQLQTVELSNFNDLFPH